MRQAAIDFGGDDIKIFGNDYSSTNYLFGEISNPLYATMK
jgi:hypothetical protein